MNRCFACNRILGKNPHLVDTRDDQLVYVGKECFKLVVKAGEEGYRYPGIGPKLWLVKTEDLQKWQVNIMGNTCTVCYGNNASSKCSACGWHGDVPRSQVS